MSQMPPGGAPVNYSTPANKPSVGLSVAAMIVGIVSIFPGCCLTVYGMIVLGVIALILGFIAKGQADQGRAGGRGMALTGIITGAIGVIIAIILMIAAHFGGQAANSWMTRMQQQIMNQQQQQQQHQQQNQTTPTSQGS